MRSPEELITMHHEATFDDRPVLVYAFNGFVDAGGGVRLASEHLLNTCEHRLVATFDIDELFDYRSRRPRMSFVVDHFAAVDIPQIGLHEVTTPDGVRFLLLAGPEPDYQWQRFIAAVEIIVRRFDVRMAIGLSAVPWPAPHTRPLGITVHGNEPELIAGFVSPLGEIEVPGHVTAMLELSLGELGIPSLGVTGQVPHYLVQFEFPQAAAALISGLARLLGSALSTERFTSGAREAEVQIAEQLAGNDEFATVLAALEQQYDLAASQSAATSSGAELVPDGRVPTAEELGAQFEAFLQGLDDTDPKD